MHKLAQAIQWREDVERGEMIQSQAWNRKRLAFPNEPVSQQELDAICAAINLYYERVESPLRITNSFGELRPK